MDKLKFEFASRTGITLWDYQLEDAKAMCAGHFGLFQDTGLGKTFTALAALLSMETPMNQHDAPTVIWIGPKLSLDMIKENMQLVWPHCYVQIIRSGTTRVDSKAAFVLTSPDLIRNATLREGLIRLKAEHVIVDEAHRFKTHDAARTVALYGSDLNGVGGVIQGASHVWLLSGTPQPNGLPGELYAHLRTLWPDRILTLASTRNSMPQPRSFWQFRNHFHTLVSMTVNGRRVWVDRGAKNLDEFKDATQGLWVRRLIGDHLDLDEPIIEETVLQPAEMGKSLDDAMSMNVNGQKQEIPASIKKLFGVLTIENIDNDLPVEQVSTLMRLTGALKVRPTVELVKNLLEDGCPQILVGFWHRDTGAGLASWLSSELGEHVGIVDGNTLAGDANAVIRKFQSGKMRVLCGQIATMGEAHNLQNCHRVVLAEQSWVPGQNKQFVARCHRQGQKNRVVVNSVTIKGSLDENVTRSLTRKIRDQEGSMV